MQPLASYRPEYRTCMTEYGNLQEVMNLCLLEGWALVGIYPAQPISDEDGEICDYYMSVWHQFVIAEETKCPTL